MVDLNIDPNSDPDASPAEPESLAQQVMRLRKEGRIASADWRKEATECYDFRAGGQWSVEDKAKLRDQKRPIITFNRVGPVLDAVAGMEVNNRQEASYLPRQVEQSGEADAMTGAANWVRDECNAEDEESEGFLDMLTCGVGCTETRMDYTADPEGNILIERVDPLETNWDPAAQRQNFIDAQWVQHERVYSRASLEARWPGKIDDINAMRSEWTDYTSADDQGPREILPGDRYANRAELGPAGKSGPDKGYLVVEHQWYEHETWRRFVDPLAGKMTALPEDDYNEAQKRLKDMGAPALDGVKQDRRKYMRAFVCQGVELESGEGPCKYSFTYKFITGKRDRNTGSWYGLVRAMMDPQRWANKWLSQTLNIINSGAKGGVIVERGAVKNIRKFEENWSDPAGVTIVEDGRLASVTLKPQTQFPAGIERLMEFAITSIRDVVGTNVELMGMADRDQPASLEYQRRQSAVTILAPLFDSLRRYRKEQGKLLIHFIQEYISDGRLIRVTGPTGAQYVPLIRKPDTLQYDIIVDEAPHSPNMKERTWQTMQPMIPMLAKIGVPGEAWLEVLKFSPLPEALVNKLAGIIEQQKQQPPPPDPKMVEVQQNAQLAQAQMAQDQQIQTAKMQADGAMKAQQMQLDQQSAALDNQAAMARMQAEMQVKTAQSQAEMDLEQKRAAFDMALAQQKQEFELALKARDQQMKAQQAESDRAMQAETEAAKTTAISKTSDVATSVKSLAEMIGKSHEMFSGMASAFMAPREIVRGKDGRVSGMRLAAH